MRPKYYRLPTGEYHVHVPVKVKRSEGFKRIDVRLKTPTKMDVYLITDYRLKGIKDGYTAMRAKPKPEKGEIEFTMIQLLPVAKARRGLIKREKELKKEFIKFKKGLGL